jgi:hypothetical protein
MSYFITLNIGYVIIFFVPQAREDRLVFARAQVEEVAYPGPGFAPLFPVTHPDAATQPAVELGYRTVVFRDAEVVHPASKVSVELVVAVLHRHPPASARQTADFVAEVGERSPRPMRKRGQVLHSDIDSLSLHLWQDLFASNWPTDSTT